MNAGRKQYAARVRTLAAADPVLTALVEPLLSITTTMTRELARLTRQVFDIVRDEPICRRLMAA